MLWMPDRRQLKARLKYRRRIWRRRVARLLLLAGILFLITAASVPTVGDLKVQAHNLTAGVQFDFVDWISLALLEEVERRLWPPATPATLDGQQQLVKKYITLQRQINRLERDINRAYARRGRANAQMEQTLARLKAEQQALVPQVETIISRQVESVLAEEGFGLGGQVTPPVTLRLVEPPTVLIISPRDKIERQHFVGLAPGLDTASRTEIEDTLHQRGDVAGYVTDVGGVGSYPTMVVGTSSLPWLVDTTAHEWVHNYLYTFPTAIAWDYGGSARLTTINETTASLVGEEVARKVINRYYPDWADELPPLDDSGQPQEAEPSPFQLAMRRIRLHVDELLAAGQVEEAEAYMEAERQELVAQGYGLRRLNQAYFAFHGSYALSPGSVDPTGPQLRRLRAASGSLREFLDRVGWLNSPADYETWLATTDE
ncbi:MAG: hypothetical protein Kow0031_06310 [Anaerolineae bacterium]